jgi:lipid-A-disaccharide synthase
MKLFLVAGEASGDARGAEVMQALGGSASGLEFFGLGGAQMKAIAGDHFHDWSDRAGVIGIIDVLKNYGFFKQKFNETLSEISRVQPDALILIDYPGFNLRLATAVRKANPAQRIIYYVSPQVWAWNQRRIPKMARTIDLMICIFPFEKPLYEKSGLRTEFVGHPMIDSLGAKMTGKPRDENLIALLPGSRRREVKKIFPVMVQSALEILKKRPGISFGAAAPSAELQDRMQGILAALAPHLPCTVTVGGAHDLMQSAAAGLVASGTATMEAAFFRLPHVVIYRAAWLTFFLGRKLVKVQWLGMANILAGREIVPEFLQEKALPGPISEAVLRLAGDSAARERFLEDTDAVIAMLGGPGAGGRAAYAILAELKRR